MKRNKILVVDDTPEIIRIIGLYLRQLENCDISFAKNASEALKEIGRDKPDLLLLDIMMPDVSGYEVAKTLQNSEDTKEIPIVFITALEDIQSITKGFECGAVDYITKPFQKGELIARITVHLQIKNLQEDLKEKNALLLDRERFLSLLVREKTQKIEDLTLGMVKALENANYLNDNDTGNHIRRVREFSVLLAEKAGCAYDFVKKIGLYASLHDVGKVGVDPYLLKKPGPYTFEERERMKEHVRIGKTLLDDDNIDPMARNIALYHHEKWDGTGYMERLKEEGIPLEARIVALADVFDALSSKRAYKPCYSKEETLSVIRSEKGKHFDPNLVEIFFNHLEAFIAIQKKYTR